MLKAFYKGERLITPQLLQVHALTTIAPTAASESQDALTFDLGRILELNQSLTRQYELEVEAASVTDDKDSAFEANPACMRKYTAGKCCVAHAHCSSERNNDIYIGNRGTRSHFLVCGSLPLQGLQF